MDDQQNIIIYRTADGRASVALYAKDGKIWLSQQQMAELFATSKPNISMHIANILKENELNDASVVKNFLTTAAIRERVIKARNIQTERFSSLPKQGGVGRVYCNAQMSERMLHDFAEPDAESLDMLRMAMERLKLSARAYSRILKVARTIADLAGSEKVQSMHIAEAIGYRNLDRGDWAERGI